MKKRNRQASAAPQKAALSGKAGTADRQQIGFPETDTLRNSGPPPEQLPRGRHPPKQRTASRKPPRAGPYPNGRTARRALGIRALLLGAGGWGLGGRCCKNLASLIFTRRCFLAALTGGLFSWVGRGSGLGTHSFSIRAAKGKVASGGQGFSPWTSPGNLFPGPFLTGDPFQL